MRAKELQTMDDLVQEVRRVSDLRGHHLGAFEGTQYKLTATCQTCKAWAQCNTHPAPNEIDMSGPALAVMCHGKSLP